MNACMFSSYLIEGVLLTLEVSTVFLSFLHCIYKEKGEPCACSFISWLYSLSLAMSKKIKLVDIRAASSKKSAAATTNWEICVLCQAETSESLTSPACSKRQDVGRAYKALAENLMKFDALGTLPRTLQLDRIDEGQGIEAAMVANEAKWHQTCKLRYKRGRGEGGRQGGKGRKEGGREGGKKRGRKGGKEGRREGGRERGREGKREVGREGGSEEGREEGRE